MRRGEARMGEKRFRAKLGGEEGEYFEVPFDVKAAFGKAIAMVLER